MSPPPRASVPTVPPLDPGIRNKLRAFVTDWKTIAVSLLGAGAIAHAYGAELATRTDLSREHNYAAGERATLQLEVGHVEGRLDLRDERDLWRDATLTAIANKLGIIVPPPPSLLKP